MNITKIEWTDWSINPVVGCPHSCEYCYAKKMAKRQIQTWHLRVGFKSAELARPGLQVER